MDLNLLGLEGYDHADELHAGELLQTWKTLVGLGLDDLICTGTTLYQGNKVDISFRVVYAAEQLTVTLYRGGGDLHPTANPSLVLELGNNEQAAELLWAWKKLIALGLDDLICRGKLSYEGALIACCFEVQYVEQKLHITLSRPSPRHESYEAIIRRMEELWGGQRIYPYGPAVTLRL